MPVVERPLTNLVLPPLSSYEPGQQLTSFTLITGPESPFAGFSWRLEFPFPNAYRIILTGPERPRPPHDNVNSPDVMCDFELVSIDKGLCRAVFAFPCSSGIALDTSGLAVVTRLELRVFWKYQLFSEVWVARGRGDDATKSAVVRDLGARSYALTEHGIIRHWQLDKSRIHLGLGEKAAPVDLTGRSFTMHATDAALYDSYRTDPLYKHTPFLISTPKPDKEGNQGLTYAIFHATNSVATWDLGREIDYPSGGWSKRFVQDWGGLEEWVIIGNGVQGVVTTFANMAGKPRLVGRDWLGYLASTVLLAELPNAQERLEEWPKLCAKHDIPCSAMHLSSGYTHDERTGAHLVFHLNKKRYPDFKGMVRTYHRAGMKIVPNVKPYLLTIHPDYERLDRGHGLFYDPFIGGSARQNLGGNAESASGNGSWADFTAPETRKWWSQGIQGLIDLGVDGIWDDNNEFFTRDDEIQFANQFDHHREVSHNKDHKVNTGLMGRITGNEMMNKVSHDKLAAAFPDRRTFVLTRSGNPAAFKYACSTWSGDNFTSWDNLRGSHHIQLNSCLSLMQNTGSDVGGFAGPKPSPELFVRWVQLGVTHSRFCIHSDGSGWKLTTPWMYPDMLPIIRKHIKWRYYILPFLNHLMWKSHLQASPPNVPLFYGNFASDPELYKPELLNGFDSWLGVGQLLVAPQLIEGAVTREVYFPKSHPDDKSLYFDISNDLDYRSKADREAAQEKLPSDLKAKLFERVNHGYYTAGEKVAIHTPLEHAGLFAREGSVIPVGKHGATVTALSGAARRYPDGTDVKLDDQDGQVAADDWRGVMIFPPPPWADYTPGKTYEGSWIEDDGISAEPSMFRVRVEYWVTVKGNLRVEAETLGRADGFEPLWNRRLYIILPEGDTRRAEGSFYGEYEDFRGGERVIGWYVEPLEFVIPLEDQLREDAV